MFIETKKALKIVYFLCVAQLLGVYVYAMTVRFEDPKMAMLYSVIFAFAVSHLARSDYYGSRFKDRNKAADKDLDQAIDNIKNKDKQE